MALDAKDFTNVEADIEFISKIANAAPDVANPGHPNGTATNRLGVTAKVATKMIEEATEAMTLNAFASLFPNGHPAALDRILTYRIIGGDLTKFYQVKTFYYHDVQGGANDDRFAVQVSQSNDAAGTGEVTVSEYVVGTGFTRANLQRITLAPVGGSGVTVEMVIDFGDGETPWAVYDGATSYATSGMARGSIQLVDNAAIDARFETLMATEANLDRGVFVPQMRNAYWRDVFKEIGIEGGLDGHDYYFSHMETTYFPNPAGNGIPLWRWRFRINDATLGIPVCEYSDSSNVDPATTGQLTDWVTFDTGSGIGGYTGVNAMANIDWSKVVWSSLNFFDYTTMAQSGIDRRNIYTNDEMDLFLENPNPRLRVTVGVAGDFPTVTEACENFYRAGLVPNNQSTIQPWSRQCGFTRQILIEVIDDNHVEDLNEVLMFPYLTIRGRGIDNTIFHHNSPDTNERLLEFRHSGCIEDCTLIQDGEAYIIHADDFNAASSTATLGPAVQYYRLRKVLRRVKLISKAVGNAWGWGCGISSWEYQLFEDCIFEKPNVSTAAGFIGIHTTPAMFRGAIVHFRRCTENTFFNVGATLISGFAQTTRNLVIVEDGNMKAVSLGSSFGNTASDMPAKAKQRLTWDASGNGVTIFDDDLMKVAKVAPGTAVGGTKGAALFGTDYDQKHGYGTSLVMEENPYRKLGVILGDCSVVNQTLTIGAVTKNLTANYTLMNQAAILADLNATFVATPISVVPFDEFVIHSDLQQRWIQAAAAIGKKRFVNIVADKAQVTSGRPDGFTVFDMALDGQDIIVESRKFAASLIPELAGYEGEFKIVAGVATATPADDPDSVGEVYNNVVRLYD